MRQSEHRLLQEHGVQRAIAGQIVEDGTRPLLLHWRTVHQNALQRAHDRVLAQASGEVGPGARVAEKHVVGRVPQE